ncbi:MAG: YggS family pyridoxal phosphate-dependent enzyme [Thermodesulfobacteriota bacterium]|nr:YggS family pyridoxal phosphate-dependent enzyme [Thermodesulfobacteriota bacterium]
MFDLGKRIDNIKENIELAAKRSSRKTQDITLLAATKGVDASAITHAIDKGMRIFGENYIQEAKKKITTINEDIEWHFIGHLQTNKAKDAVKLFHTIHSLDSLRLAHIINTHAEKYERQLPIFIEINLSREESKSGIEENDLFLLAEQVLKMKNLKLVGLMTIPPILANPEDSRPYYKHLACLLLQLNSKLNQNMQGLSMGMSRDYEVAIEEGATIVRIGSAIFGPRH